MPYPDSSARNCTSEVIAFCTSEPRRSFSTGVRGREILRTSHASMFSASVSASRIDYGGWPLPPFARAFLLSPFRPAALRRALGGIRGWRAVLSLSFSGGIFGGCGEVCLGRRRLRNAAVDQVVLAEGDEVRGHPVDEEPRGEPC